MAAVSGSSRPRPRCPEGLLGLGGCRGGFASFRGLLRALKASAAYAGLSASPHNPTEAARPRASAGWRRQPQGCGLPLGLPWCDTDPHDSSACVECVPWVREAQLPQHPGKHPETAQ